MWTQQYRQFSCWDLQMLMPVVPLIWYVAGRRGGSLVKESHGILGSVVQTAIAVKQ